MIFLNRRVRKLWKTLKQTQRKYFYAVAVILILFFIYGVTKIRIKQKNLSKQENKYNSENAETINSNLVSNYSEKDELVFDSTKNEPSDLIKKKIRNKIDNMPKTNTPVEFGTGICPN